DNAPAQFKARAISFVLAGGIVTAILGPQVVIFTKDLLAPVPFAGAFASILVLSVAGGAILFFLNTPRPSQAEHAAAH
ncbi:MFS transporter, partial [Klebsiella variicola]